MLTLTWEGCREMGRMNRSKWCSGSGVRGSWGEVSWASQETKAIAWLDSTSWDGRCETAVSHNSLLLVREGRVTVRFCVFPVCSLPCCDSPTPHPWHIPELYFLAPVTGGGEAESPYVKCVVRVVSPCQSQLCPGTSQCVLRAVVTGSFTTKTMV